MAEYIKIRTARNVEIEYALAGLGDRVIARIVDSIIQIGYIFLMVIILNAGFNYPMMFLLSIPLVFYSFLFERFNNGQTPGKNIVRIRVASITGESPTTQMYFLRWLFLIIDLRLLTGAIGMIAILVSDDAQRLGDIVAGTTVISLKPKKTLRDTLHRKINANYRPAYESVNSMSDFDIQTIQNVLRSKSDNKSSLIQMTAIKIEEEYNISRTEDARIFLNRIVNDYNYYQYHEHLKSYEAYEINEEST